MSQQQGHIGVSLSAILLAIMAILCYIILNNLNDSYHELNHTLEVISKVDKSRRLITACQSSVRGYVISEETYFLTPYNTYLPQIIPSVLDLEQLVQDDPEQIRMTQELKQEMIGKINSLKRTLAFIEANGFESGRKYVTSRQGEQTMVKIGKTCEDLQNLEYKLKEERTQTVHRYVNYGYYGMPLLIVASVIVLAISYSITSIKQR